jgi:hypothetical protein
MLSNKALSRESSQPDDHRKIKKRYVDVEPYSVAPSGAVLESNVEIRRGM